MTSEEWGRLNPRRWFRQDQAERPSGTPEPDYQALTDDVRLATAPAIEHAFRSLARNPSRFRQILVDLYLVDSTERRQWITTGFAQTFPAAWSEVLDQYAKRRDQLPHGLKAEDDFVSAVAQCWGEVLFIWARQLYRRNESFRQAVDRGQDRSGNPSTPAQPDT